MKSIRITWILCVAVACLDPITLSPVFAEDPAPAQVQLDVFVRGPENKIAHLSADDFELEVGGQKVTGLVVRGISGTEHSASGMEDSGLRMVPTDFVFYLQGVQASENGVPVHAAGLVEALIKGRNRGMIIVDGSELSMIQDFTDNSDELLAALRQVETSELDPNKLSRTLANASVEETNRSARRLASLLHRLAVLELPRVLIHIGPRTRYSDPAPGLAIANAANENLFRIYHYPNNDIAFSSGRANAVHVGIAKPTGGLSFSDTDTAKKVAGRIVRDLQGLYLLTFEVHGLEDAGPHDVFLASRARKVSMSTRQQLVLPSEP